MTQNTEHHARFSPSKLSRLLSCTGAILLEEELASDNIQEQTTSSYAQEGTRLHELIADCLQARRNNKTLPITEPLVQDCFDYANLLLSEPGTKIIGVEEKVSLLPYGEPDVYGTLDFAVFNEVKNILHVIDWKFGYNKVYAKNNDQLQAYAAGQIATDFTDILNDIVLHIFQPAIDHIDTWSVSNDALHLWTVNTMFTLSQIRNGKTQYKPSVEACKWCKVAPVCKANHDFNLTIAQDIFKQFTAISDKTIVSPADLKGLLDRGKVFKQHLTVVHDYIMDKLLTDGEYPGYKLVAGRASRNWNKESELIDWICENDEDFDIDNIYETKLKTPAKVEKLNKAWKKDEDFQALYTKTSKPIMVSEDDKRPKYEAASVFDAHKQTTVSA